MDDRIWVICISHDYGVWGEAGYYFSEEDAEKWIKQRIDKDRIRHAEFIADWESTNDGGGRPTDDDKEFTPSKFYAVEMKQGNVA